MKICLTVLMGLPGSGKTTFAKTLQKDFRNYDGKHFNFIHVCYDELLPPVSFEEVEEGETRWKVLRTDVLNQIDLLLSSVKNNRFESCPKHFRAQLDLSSRDTAVVILIDDNMYLKSMRYALFKKAREYSVSFCQVYLECPLEVSNERNLFRSSEEVIPFHVISHMNGRIEAPKNTNKWERYSLIVEAHNDNYNIYTDYFNMLKITLENPEFLNNEDDFREKEKDAIICMQNVLHQSDIALRQIISEKIQDFISKKGSGKGLKDYSAELCIKKGKILSEIKLGAIEVPLAVLTENRESNESEKKCLKLFLEEIFNS